MVVFYRSLSGIPLEPFWVLAKPAERAHAAEQAQEADWIAGVNKAAELAELAEVEAWLLAHATGVRP